MRLLTYDRRPVAFIEFLPNNAFLDVGDATTRDERTYDHGTQMIIAAGVLCGRVSPDEGCADIVEINDENVIAALRAGQDVDLNPFLPDKDD